jgi:hypothetical protein
MWGGASVDAEPIHPAGGEVPLTDDDVRDAHCQTCGRLITRCNGHEPTIPVARVREVYRRMADHPYGLTGFGALDVFNALGIDIDEPD